MKRKLFYLTISLMIFITTNLMSQQVPFTILHFSDSHSYLLGTGEKNSNLNYLKGGISRVASFVTNTRNTDTNVLVFHSGDIFTGDFYFNKYFSATEFNILSRLQLDAIAVGNHEFDLGPQVLYNALENGFEGNNIPMLSANLDLNGFPSLNNFIYPFIVKQYSGLKIGIFGLTFPDPSSNPFPVVISDSIMQIAGKTVEFLNNEMRCDVIICLSHLGLSFDTYIASAIPGINIILGGHDHLLTLQPVFVPNPAGFNTIICHPGDHYKYVGKLKFNYSNGNVIYKSYTPVEINTSIPESPRISEYINLYKAGIVQQFGEVYTKIISVAKYNIFPVWDTTGSFRDTPLGNLVTDAYRYKTNTQISISALGLMEGSIYKGIVTGNDLQRATPYGFDTTTMLGFSLVKFKITGSELKRALELIFATAPDNTSYFPQFAGLVFSYNKNLPIGGRIILSSMFVNDTAFSLTKNYSATVNSGLFRVINELGIQVSDVMQTLIPEYTCMYDYVSTFDTLRYTSQGRVKDVTLTGSENGISAVKDYKLYNCYPNPFNASTVIKYSLTKNSFVNIKVFDVTGKELSTLVNQFQQSGEYSIRFNGDNFSTGVYFYRMESDGFVQTKKFVLIK